MTPWGKFISLSIREFVLFWVNCSFESGQLLAVLGVHFVQTKKCQEKFRSSHFIGSSFVVVSQPVGKGGIKENPLEEQPKQKQSQGT